MSSRHRNGSRDARMHETMPMSELSSQVNDNDPARTDSRMAAPSRMAPNSTTSAWRCRARSSPPLDGGPSAVRMSPPAGRAAPDHQLLPRSTAPDRAEPTGSPSRSAARAKARLRQADASDGHGRARAAVAAGDPVYCPADERG